MTFEDCLNLTLRILPLLLQVSVDISYKMQIPLIIAYCPESSIYRRWHTGHGRVSSFHKEVRASRTLTKVLGSIHHQIAREWTTPRLPPSPKALWDQTGCEAPELGHVPIPKVSPRTTAVDQVLPAPGPLKMTLNPPVGPSPPMQKRTLRMMMNMQRFVRVKS